MRAVTVCADMSTSSRAILGRGSTQTREAKGTDPKHIGSIIAEIRNLCDNLQQELLAEMRLVGRHLQDEIRREFRMLGTKNHPFDVEQSPRNNEFTSGGEHTAGGEQNCKGGQLRCSASQPSTIPGAMLLGRVGNLDMRRNPSKGRKLHKKLHDLPEYDFDLISNASVPEGGTPAMMLSNAPVDVENINGMALSTAAGTSGSSTSGGAHRSANAAGALMQSHADEAAGGLVVKSPGLIVNSAVKRVRISEIQNDPIQQVLAEDEGIEREVIEKSTNRQQTSLVTFTKLDEEDMPSDIFEGSHPRPGSRRGSSRLSYKAEGSAMLDYAMRQRLSTTRAIARTSSNSNQRKPLWEMSLAEAIKSPTFDNVVGSIILLNAAVIGIQTDWNAKKLTNDVPMRFFIFEQFFAVWFSSELFIRVWVYKCAFFKPCAEGWLWNYFDFFIVFVQLFEIFFELVARSTNFDVINLRLLKVMRVLRLVRILRVVRVLHLISELRAIVSSIAGSFRSLLWVVVLLFLMVYIVAVYFVQSITDHLVTQKDDSQDNGIHWEPSEEESVLINYFGSLIRAILSLWQAMSGGLDWDTLAAPLLNQISLMTGFAFAAYIAFALLALMNVVTGVFVQTALNSAREEEDSFLTSQIIQLFEIADKDGSATISMDEISVSLDDPQCAKEWKNAGVNAEDARYLFRLLDLDGSGEVAFEEFLGGCLRLTGGAKAIDLLTVMQEARKNSENVTQSCDKIESALENVERMQTKCTNTVQQMHHVIEQLTFDVSALQNIAADQEDAVAGVKILMLRSLDGINARLGPLRLLQDVLSENPMAPPSDIPMAPPSESTSTLV